MKRRKKKPKDLLKQFQTTCGWCGKRIPDDTPVFAGGGKTKPACDLSHEAGLVILVEIVTAGKTVLIGVCGLDSKAKREGKDFVYMTCSEECGNCMREAFLADVEFGERLRSRDTMNS